MILRLHSPHQSRRLFPPKQRRIWAEAQDTTTTIDKGHGRRERRTLTATIALNEYLDWPGVAQVGQIESVVEQDGKVSHETRYFITSVPRDLGGARLRTPDLRDFDLEPSREFQPRLRLSRPIANWCRDK